MMPSTVGVEICPVRGRESLPRQTATDGIVADVVPTA
jgi:hypothetical protein